MQILRRGSRDPQVTFLQRCLNRALGNDRHFRGVVEDGIFGAETETNLRQFQTRNLNRHGITIVDGVAGPAAWRAFGVVTEIDHRLPRVGQNTMMSCWEVSSGLATRRNTSAVPALAQVGANGGLRPSLDNIQTFGREIGFRLLPMVPMRVEDILPHVRTGPVLLVGRWTNGGLHMVVISGYFATADVNGRMIQVNDPAAPGGGIYITDYPNMNLSGGPFDPYCLLVR